MRRFVFGVWLFSVLLALLAAGACGARSGLEAPFIERDEEEPLGGSGPECAVYQSAAQLAALDVFMMIDKSGSMTYPTDSGSTKWDSVRFALSAFFYAPESAGIGISLGYFPHYDPSLQIECGPGTCGPFATCVLHKVCGTSWVPCIDQSTCEAKGVGEEPCVPLGSCLDQSACLPDLGIECSSGSCALSGVCDGALECVEDLYATPAMEVSRLPEAASALMDNVKAQSPFGATPTAPALAGVAKLATQWHGDNPDHEAIIVLITDGFPSSCEPGNPDEALVETAATAAAAGVRTFVIGVFGTEEAAEAEASLGLIAAAGGTGEAFVITTAQEVTEVFLEALNEVRLDAKACEFGVQVAEPIDFDDVWVKITSETGSPVWVRRVAGPADCDNEEGGFFYDPEPQPGDLFANVVLCPETCTLLGATTDRRAEVYTECADPSAP